MKIFHLPLDLLFSSTSTVISHQADDLNNKFIYFFLLIEVKPADVSFIIFAPYRGEGFASTRPRPNPSLT